MNNLQNKATILGVNISPLTYKKTLACIEDYINKKKKGYICVSAVHLIMECQKNILLKRGVNAATLVTPDGMPLVWLLRSRGASTERVYGPNLMLKTCELAAKKGWRVFLLGGSIRESKTLQSKLLQQFPPLCIVGAIDTPSLPLTDKENQKVIDSINKSHAQVVLVGEGCPTQELWMIENRGALKPNILISVGAAFDFISGKKKQAPWLLQTLGFEWLFRLVQEPKRLGYRYMIQNTMFILYLAGFKPPDSMSVQKF